LQLQKTSLLIVWNAADDVEEADLHGETSDSPSPGWAWDNTDVVAYDTQVGGTKSGRFEWVDWAVTGEAD
jgi:hypothetical protein